MIAGMRGRRPRAVALGVAINLLAAVAWADLVASDNADNDPYPVSGFLPDDNGGFGFRPWLVLESGTPGAMFTTTAIDDGVYSWGVSGTYALGRGLSGGMGSGRWRLLAMHDPDNTAFSGFNLRSSTNIGGGFADYELIRFGFDPSQIGYDGTGIYVSTNGGVSYALLDCGWVDGAGDTLEYAMSWDEAGAWSLMVSNLDEEVASTFEGSLASASPVEMLGSAVFGSSNDETLTFDDYGVVPEPGAAVTVVLGAWLVQRIFRGRTRKSVPGVIRV